MELSQSIETINKYLIDTFGLESSINKPMFRVVFSDDQYEKRLTDFINGIQLLRPEVRELPKYFWIKGRYILERLVVVPEINMPELPTSKLSYECIWIFENQSGTEALPPRIDACKIIVDTMYAAMGKSSLRKYIDEEANTTKEGRDAKIKQLQEELFGNETPATDALAYGTGVSLSGPRFETAMSNSPNGDK